MPSFTCLCAAVLAYAEYSKIAKSSPPIHKNQVLRFVLKRVRPTPYNFHTRIHFSTNVKEFYEGFLELISHYSKSCI